MKSSEQGKIIAINLPPYLKQFLIHIYGKEPIKLKRTTKLYILLVQYVAYIHEGWQIPDISENVLHIELPYNILIERSRLGYIPPRSNHEIKQFICGLFYGEFIQYMYGKVLKEKWCIKYAIINFIDQYDINYNRTNYETLKKIFNRQINSAKKKNRSSILEKEIVNI